MVNVGGDRGGAAWLSVLRGSGGEPLQWSDRDGDLTGQAEIPVHLLKLKILNVKV